MSTHIPQSSSVNHDGVVRLRERAGMSLEESLLLLPPRHRQRRNHRNRPRPQRTGPTSQHRTISEGDLEAGIFLDAHGAAVLRSVLGPADQDDSGFIPEENEGLIAAAIVYERTVEFAYDKGSGVIEQRRVVPRVTYAAPNGVVVTGDDQDRDDVRAFRLDRIQGSVRVV